MASPVQRTNQYANSVARQHCAAHGERTVPVWNDRNRCSSDLDIVASRWHHDHIHHARSINAHDLGRLGEQRELGFRNETGYLDDLESQFPHSGFVILHVDEFVPEGSPLFPIAARYAGFYISRRPRKAPLFGVFLTSPLREPVGFHVSNHAWSFGAKFRNRLS